MIRPVQHAPCQMPTLPLPEEILTAIFKRIVDSPNSREEESALWKCARVSRQWHRIIHGDVLPALYRLKISLGIQFLQEAQKTNALRYLPTGREGFCRIEQMVQKLYSLQILPHISIPSVCQSQAFAGIHTFLQEYPRKSLLLHNVSVTPSFLAILLQAMKSGNVKRLHFFGCELQEGCCEVFASQLPHATQLEYLSLSSIAGEGLNEKLFEGAAKCQQLKVLFLSKVHIEPDWIALLAQCRMKALFFVSCNLSAKHMQPLCRVLEGNENVKMLNLVSNMLTTWDLLELSSVKGSLLEELCVHGNLCHYPGEFYPRESLVVLLRKNFTSLQNIFF